MLLKTGKGFVLLACLFAAASCGLTIHDRYSLCDSRFAPVFFKNSSACAPQMNAKSPFNPDTSERSSFSPLGDVDSGS